jgi:hypothetical protein
LTHGECSLEEPISSDSSDAVTDNLRELAAAANAMQGEHIVTATGSQGQKPLDSKTAHDAPPSASQPCGIFQQNQLTSTSFAGTGTTALPRYTIKTVGPNGWEHIENVEQWNDLLLRRGHEVWADGVVNMVVELVDVPARIEPTRGRKHEEIVNAGGNKVG